MASAVSHPRGSHPSSEARYRPPVASSRPSPAPSAASQQAPTQPAPPKGPHAAIQLLRPRAGSTGQAPFRCVCWNATGSRLATASTQGGVAVWNPERMPPPPATSNVSGRGGGRGAAANTSTASFCWELRGHVGVVERIAWDPTHADRLCSVSADKTLRVWDYRNTQQLFSLDLGDAGFCAVYSPDGKRIAVATKQGMLHIVDVGTQKIVQSWQEDQTGVNELCFSHAGTLLCMTMQSGTVRIYETNRWTFLHAVGGSTSAVYCLEFDPRGRYLAVGGADAIVSLWDLQDWTCVRTFYKMSHPVRSLSFSHDGRYLAFGSEDAFIDVSCVESGEQVHKVTTNAPVASVSFSPFKYALAYATESKSLVVAS